MHRLVICSGIFACLFLVRLGTRLQADSSIPRFEQEFRTVCDSDAHAEHGHPFRVGEKLVYKIHWGIMTIAEATLSIESELEDEHGRRVLHLVAKTKSGSIMNTVYPVNDTLHSFVDAQSLFSYRYIEDRSEGKNRYLRTTGFDYEKMTARLVDEGRSHEKEFELSTTVQDALSCLYYFRSRRVEDVQDIKVPTINAYKIYEVSLNDLGSKTVSTRFGKVKTICFQPKASPKGFIPSDGKTQVWISDDKFRLPVKIISKAPFGYVKVTLAEVHGVEDWNGWKQ